jgi:protein gp37
MGDSNIEWLRGPDGSRGKTWNPLLGCRKKSPGCDDCYAIVSAHIRASNPHPAIKAAFSGLTIRTKDGLDWTGKVNLLHDRLEQPLHWRKPQYVFVNSMSDLFYGPVPEDYIAEIFAVMLATPRHIYIALTKEHARMRSLLNKHDFINRVFEIAVRKYDYPFNAQPWWPLPNLILGVSVENQKWADIRVPYLLDTPATYRALSVEPLVGPLDLDQPRCDDHDRQEIVTDDVGREWCGDCAADGFSGELSQGHWLDPLNGGINLVIVGGESGHGTVRAMHPQWARDLRDQVKEAGGCFFFKQWGEWGPAPFVVRVCDPKVGWQGTDEELVAAKKASEAAGATHVHTGNWYREDGEIVYHLHEIGHKPWSLERAELPGGLEEPIRRWGKKAAGNLLDGRRWTEMPVAPGAAQ